MGDGLTYGAKGHWGNREGGSAVECGAEWGQAGGVGRFGTPPDLGLVLHSGPRGWFGPTWPTRPAGWSSVWSRLGTAPGTASSQPASVGGGKAALTQIAVEARRSWLENDE
ncbi:LYR motif-containing protein 1 isoform X5 [Nannospalax galili]|uniref:LYR motif-containing protein 1 isoform X5 n=1 Tax=Nannospalax galili TaxID=1026970 RepID=UPI00111C5B9A|nr:LYR motif-containing protein 1 isoform X5 [Nannospalax galili]